MNKSLKRSYFRLFSLVIGIVLTSSTPFNTHAANNLIKQYDIASLAASFAEPYKKILPFMGAGIAIGAVGITGIGALSYLSKCDPLGTKEYDSKDYNHVYPSSLDTFSHRILHNECSVRLLSIVLPSDFLVGTSSSAHQYGPQCATITTGQEDFCDCARFAKKHRLPQPIKEDGYHLDINEKYEYYLDIMKSHGLTAFRFEVSWPLVQPQSAEQYDTTALDLYAKIFKAALVRGIIPVVCLHHYHNPCWFADKGGFGHESNKTYFAHFCARVYTTLMKAALEDPEAAQAFDKIQPYFATFNSPEGAAFKSCYTRDLPLPAGPIKKGLRGALEMLKNMCQAHVDAAEEIQSAHTDLKKKYRLNPPLIGFLKNIYQLDSPTSKRDRNYKKDGDSFQKRWTNFICRFGNSMQDDAIFDFFTTGKFSKLGIRSDTRYTKSRCQASLTWIGLNYYSNAFHDGIYPFFEKNPELKTSQSKYRVYPTGIYRALMKLNEKIAQPLDIPILVTENGFSPSKDDPNPNEKRNQFYSNYLGMIAAAISDGCNVKGYLTWSFADNYEWKSPKAQNDPHYYGIFSVNSDGTVQLKDPHNFIIALAEAFRDDKLAAAAQAEADGKAEENNTSGDTPEGTGGDAAGTGGSMAPQSTVIKAGAGKENWAGIQSDNLKTLFLTLAVTELVIFSPIIMAALKPAH